MRVMSASQIKVSNRGPAEIPLAGKNPWPAHCAAIPGSPSLSSHPASLATNDFKITRGNFKRINWLSIGPPIAYNCHMDFHASVPSGILTPSDVAFLCDVLEQSGQPEAIRSLMEDESALMAILELAEVRRAIIESPALVGISPQLYFLVIVRHVFGRAGMHSTGLTQYVATMLATRVKSPRTPDGDDRLPDYAVDFVERAAVAGRGSGAHGSESFAWWKAAGDHFLVLTGLFPAHLDSRCERRGAPSLDFYVDFGARSYRTAADHPQARRRGLSPVLHDLAATFPEARRALNQAAEEYLFLAN
jgi:hypothetical protein